MKDNQQLTDTLLMIRPVKFGYNVETAINNHYQRELGDVLPEEIQHRALAEFNQFVDVLRQQGVNVITVDDTAEKETPDSIFPNNWISFHQDGTVVTYPMWAPNRRKERRDDILSTLIKEHRYAIRRKIDYSYFEAEEKFLEGTGSMVLDRQNRIAYACVSPRTHLHLLSEFCQEFGYRPIVFIASQMINEGFAEIYHTNVMMSIGEDFAIFCADALKNTWEQKDIVKIIRDTGKEVIFISEEQCNHFAGNMLQVKNQQNEQLLVMSSQAYRSLTKNQLNQLEQYTDIVHSPLSTIEACGGGSARCMMAEIFLPKN
ncbi:citrulline utilization hydrolase CtlX [Tunicatimonas pelagia]|uniref:citrulline utilization hydrolase CtlX n=1 Tax=Tunicatimonas pelagia TaxID=931531 RepID=UPI0026663F41|nr:arginine deiminase-related protein [Tunicatimonas pelagia]WKN41183.1 arginine deiminase-related protein [Tunicatimonas pelagia]